jgi:hypothetical protein
MTDSVFMFNRFPQVSRMQVTVHKPYAPFAGALADVGVTIVRGRLKIEQLRAAKGEVGEFAASFPLRIGRLFTAAR